jgi:hypothetical protein
MSWQISGQYAETCNCDFICPCILTQMAQTTHGECKFAMAYHVDSGAFDGVDLSGAKFIVVGYTPGNMNAGNWEVGLIVDEGASDAQKEALTNIASGQAGGPMANIAPLIGKFHGVETAPIAIEGDDGTWSVVAPGLVDQALEGARSMSGEVLHMDNVGHPVGDRLALARAKHSRFSAFGIEYDESSGRNNGHFAPFSWSGG